ncbi:SDR family oxidoreductase [Pseudomonas sp. B21-053]|uniref:SDR family oxidoreductase n=1 Tax=Pseudomonas sp. B21-053 TaxID=2895493 RepID=UPI00222F2CF8|nr:SDR family oxidoreductase [Pseudomonas sp. B21-053]UZE15065.1 SDR family oxidoreductase [Pseudomonas sp. B21-053]
MSNLPTDQVESDDAAGRERREFIKAGLVVTAAALLPGLAASASAATATATGAQAQALRGAGKKVWMITGSSRGLGLAIARSALAAGHAVVATGRNPQRVAAALGNHPDLLTVRLDVTRPEEAHTAVEAAVGRFGRIDVLVNNAGNFYAGFFEELSPDQVRSQIETLLFGPMNVARATLPVMRKQRSGLLLNISSSGGITGGMFCTAYSAAKFGIEGWTESLIPEIEPYGIRTMLVEPGFFRTELLTPASTTYAEPSIDDYAPRTRETVTAWKGMDGKQPGDPAKLANAIVQLAGREQPPLRFPGGADAVQTFEVKSKTLAEQANANRALSSALAHDA